MAKEQPLPRGEIASRVKRQLTAGVNSYHTISLLAEIPISKVVHAVSEFQRKGQFLPNDQIRALRQHEHDEAHSESRGGLWQMIRPYAHLGMYPGEIKEIVAMVHGVELNRVNIKNTLVRKRRKGYITSSPPKKGDSGKTVDKELLMLWLDAAAFSIDKVDLRIATPPRERWLALVDRLKELGVIRPQLDSWNDVQPEWVRKCKEREIEVIRRRISNKSA